MSLVGDALRKARQDAADRDSERRGMLFSARISDSPRHSQLGLGLAIGAIIALAATIGGGAAVLWFLDRSAPADPTTVVENIETSGPALDPIETGAVPADGAVLPAVPDREAKVEPTSHTVAPALDTTAGQGDASYPGRESPADARDPQEEPVEQPVTNRSEGFTGTIDGEEIYIIEADLGSLVLSLDFIVFRADDPFAEINGVELHVGGVVEGYRVKSIDRDRVHLSDGRRNIVLRTP